MPYSYIKKALQLEVTDQQTSRQLGTLMMSVSNTGSFADVVENKDSEDR